MSDILKVFQSEGDITAGVLRADLLAHGLGDILSDVYCLLFKTHTYHWNASGPHLISLKALTDEHFVQMFKAAGRIAERMRALGHPAPHQLQEVMERSRIEDAENLPNGSEMVLELARDHEILAGRLHALIELARESNDPVTTAMATDISAFHENATWSLKAIAIS